jgi:amidase
MNVDVSASEFLQREQRPCQYMVWVNVAGVPALSLPLGQHSSGLPIGVQLAARPGHEEQLIAIGAQLEHAMPWRDRLPPTHVSRIL